MKVGVLALQGAAGLHLAALASVGAAALAVRRPDELADVDRLILPGGESTTISMLLEANGLVQPLAERIAGGMAVLGTCAGLLLLATDVADGRDDQRCFGALDISARRNAYGPQSESFEAPLQVAALGPAPLTAIFIRSPVVERTGPDVEVLARLDGRPVLCRQGRVWGCTFHPELSGDLRLHRLFCEEAP
ncbi:MAG: pyridoxal 5'-phosphate synthase glutaminase subunit PdxT [bacterium]|nr:pyridoxal 5'-phosphate synthase glutaminase subunit PdxT [bacterium]